MIGIIVAQNKDGVIGVNGSVPWANEAYGRADQKRFKAVTMGSTVIMGRKTWESIPAKFRPLPGRFNMIVSTSAARKPIYEHEDVGDAVSVEDAMNYLRVRHATLGAAQTNKDIWFIGGARIYAEAMQYVDVIDVTWVPWELFDWKEKLSAAMYPNNIVRFPPIDETVFAPGPREPHPDDAALALQRFTRIKK